MSVKCAMIATAIEKLAPLMMAESWDNVGLLVGNDEQMVDSALLTVDVTMPVIEEAVELGAKLLISHHPFPFRALKRICTDTANGAMLAKLFKHDIAVYAAHTNLDRANSGVNTALAKGLGLIDQAPILPFSEPLVKIVVYVPAGYEEAVRLAMCNAGAGHSGNYSDCAFRTKGLGTFTPRAGSRPFLGEVAKLSTVEEFRLETLSPANLTSAVVRAMIAVHPYEEVAYDVLPLQNTIMNGGLGRIGMLPEAMTLTDFSLQVKKTLQADGVRVYGAADTVRKVAVCGGAGMDCAAAAVAAGADVLVTGDIRYHDAQEALAQGLCLIDAGHFETEYPVLQELQSYLQECAIVEKWNCRFAVAQRQAPIFRQF